LRVLDTSELTGATWEQAANPILLAYKFLSSNIVLSLRVKKHVDVSVLIAVVEAVHMMLCQTSEGRLLTKIVARVRNTQKQFLRIAASKTSDVWSTVVAGHPVKPARDSEGSVMVPLQKSASSDENKSFVVEFVFFRQSQPMTNDGQLEFDLPLLDLPVNQLFISIWLPQDFNYGEFEGDLKEKLTAFSSSPPSSPTLETLEAKPQSVQRHRRADSISRMAEDSDSDHEEEEEAPSASVLAPVAKAVGVIPVQIDVPVSGREFRFEQVLVSSSKIKLTVRYRQKTRSYWQKRHVRSCQCALM